MRPFLIELLQEGVELGLLRQDVGACRASGAESGSQERTLTALRSEDAVAFTVTKGQTLVPFLIPSY